MATLTVKYLGQQHRADFQDAGEAVRFARDQLVLSLPEYYQLKDTGALDTFDGIHAEIMEGENE